MCKNTHQTKNGVNKVIFSSYFKWVYKLYHRIEWTECMTIIRCKIFILIVCKITVGIHNCFQRNIFNQCTLAYTHSLTFNENGDNFNDIFIYT